MMSAPQHRPAKTPSRRLALAVCVAVCVGAATLFGITTLDTPESSTTPATTPTPLQPSAAATGLAQATLLALIPLGYDSGDCQASDPGPGVHAALACGPHPGHGGPDSATYLLTAPAAAADELAAATAAESPTACPGSPTSGVTPWRAPAAAGTPRTGVMLCSTSDIAVVGWTEDGLVAVARNHSPRPDAMDRLYRWWLSIHT